jgi:hypothetical protein
MIEAGFGKVDITPRVGVELCGFGPYINRHSIGIRDRLYARAMAVRQDGRTLVLVSCDLPGVTLAMTRRARAAVQKAAGIPAEAVMVHCTHTHSAPNTIDIFGWGADDAPYREVLPQRIAKACLQAVENLSEASFRYGKAACEGVGLNREYDKDAPALEDVLSETWRPAKPELTDTVCHVIAVEKQGKLAGFLSYFGCHPVVCCAASRYIHGDYCGVATNLLEKEHPGSTGLFLQGAQGDVNTCVVHKPEQEALLALDVVAGRYARSVREALRTAQPVEATPLRCLLREVSFRRKPIPVEQLRTWLSEKEAIVHAPGASDADATVRMATVYVMAIRNLLDRAERSQTLEPATEVQGFRLGPIALLGSPFEIFQAVKNDVVASAKAPIPLVLGITNDLLGYAPDRTAAARGGYAADMVPLMLGQLPFADIHDQLVKTLLDLDGSLAVGGPHGQPEQT